MINGLNLAQVANLRQQGLIILTKKNNNLPILQILF